jgi:hypothetical protein
VLDHAGEAVTEALGGAPVEAKDELVEIGWQVLGVYLTNQASLTAYAMETMEMPVKLSKEPALRCGFDRDRRNLILSRREALFFAIQCCAICLPVIPPNFQDGIEQLWSDSTYWDDGCGWAS